MKRHVFFYVVAMITSIGAVSMGQATLINTGVDRSWAMSPDGTAVTTQGYLSNGYWTQAAGVTIIGGTDIAAIANDFTIAGDSQFDYEGQTDVDMAAYWTPATGWNAIYGFPGSQPCGASLSHSWDMSSNGRYVAGHSWRDDRSCKTHGMVYDIETGTTMRLAGVENDSTSVKAVSNDGKLMAGWEQTSNRVPLIWDEYGIPTRVPNPGVGEGSVVSADGVWAGGSMSDSAWLWSQATGFVQIGMLVNPNFTAAEPTDITADGSFAIGGHVAPPAIGLQEGWVWDEAGGIRSFKDFCIGLGLTQAYSWTKSPVPNAISDDGSVIQFGLNGIAQLLVIDQPDTCELDWDCDNLITIDDVISFYWDYKYYEAYWNHPTLGPLVDGGYEHKQNCGEPGNQDWNENGLIELNDVFTAQAALGNIYWQYIIYADYPSLYATYFPNSTCTP